MSAGRRKSKKPFAANYKPQHEPTLFLDRNLGKHIVASRLRSEGMKVEVHDDHFPSAAPDEDWIALVGRRTWLAITKDRNIRYRTAELDAIRRLKARVFVIRMKDATGPEVAELLVKGRRRSHFGGYAPPFVASMQSDM